MDDSSYRLNFDLGGKKNKIHHYSYTPKNYDLFKVVENRMQQCCAAHIVQLSTILFSIVEPESARNQLRTEICTTFEPKVVQISAYNTKVYKICEICWAVFSSFYNISRPNLAILLILSCSF